MGLIQKIFGTHSENELKRIYPIVDAIEALEPEMQKLSDQELKEKTKEFKRRLEEGETLDDLLPEHCRCQRGGSPDTGNAPLPCTADRRYYPASGQDRGDEDRRR